MTTSARTIQVAVVVAAALAVALVVGIAADHLPPRTPWKVARIVSELHVPNSARVVSFRDEWTSFDGDGITSIDLRLKPADFAKLQSEALSKGYVRMNSAEPVPEFVRAQVGSGKTGLYRFKRDSDSSAFELSYLDSADQRLFVLLLIQ